MRQSACELVRKGEEKRKGNAVESIKTTSGRKIYLCGGRYDAMTDYTLPECHRCPLFVNRYTFVDERELTENGILRPEEHII
jgi:hypothetical protein